MLISLAIVAATVVAMEIVACVTHRYVMHGPGWAWHRSHHEPHDGFFEKNDLYAAIFTLAAVAFLGFAALGPLYWVGVGMTVYGILYFAVHDGLVHGRWPFRIVPKNRYLKRLVQRRTACITRSKAGTIVSRSASSTRRPCESCGSSSRTGTATP
jgi:beta-carotene 3-hydroxylase